MRGRRDSGSGSVLVVGGIVLLLVVGGPALVLVGVVRATHQARSAADLAALSGAQFLAGGALPRTACARAAKVAEANGGRLRGCSADDVSGVVEVEVEVTVPGSAGRAPGLGPAHLGPASSWARAGPAGSGGAGR